MAAARSWPDAATGNVSTKAVVTQMMLGNSHWTLLPYFQAASISRNQTETLPKPVICLNSSPVRWNTVPAEA